MPTAKIVHMFSEGEVQEKLLLQVAIQCAPMLKGLKVSSIMLLSREMTRELFRLMRGTNIRVKILCRRERKLVLFLYRRGQLKKHLQNRQVKDALHQFGYVGEDAQELLGQLAKRTAQAYKEHGTCPHEIGLFLGYPVGDVMGFVEHQGADYLMSGYWKVYQDVHTANEIFRQYNMAKEEAVHQVFAGFTLNQIAQAG